MTELMTRLPQPLREGDKVSIISPAGAIDSEYVDGAIVRLKRWGLHPIVAANALGCYGRYSATASHRLADINEALRCSEVRAILCSRGGYGTMHLLEGIDRRAIQADPKWLIGYSDVTALHALMSQCGVASIHAPMARHLSEAVSDDYPVEVLRNLLFGTMPRYELPPCPHNREGIASGVVRGGNLALIYALRATNYDFDPNHTILFIEDVGERSYQIERMLYNLRLSGVFDRISGLIVGSFTDSDNDPSMAPLQAIIESVVEPYSFPVCYGFPVGHTLENYPMICGARATLSISSERTLLSFI